MFLFPSEAALGFCHLDCWTMRVEAINEMHGEAQWENRWFWHSLGTSCVSHCSLETHVQRDYSKPVPITTCFYYIAWHLLTSPAATFSVPVTASPGMWFLSQFVLLWVVLRRRIHFPPSLGFVTLRFLIFIHISIEVWMGVMVLVQAKPTRVHGAASSLVEASQLQWYRRVSVREFESPGVFCFKEKSLWIHYSLYWFNSSCSPHIDLDCSPETVSLEFLSFQSKIQRKKCHTFELSIICKKCFLGMASFIRLLLSNLWLLTRNKHTEVLRMNGLVW